MCVSEGLWLENYLTRNVAALRNFNNNNNNNTYIAHIFSSALKNKNIKKKKILRLHKVHMQKVHEPTKKNKTIMSTLKL